MSRLMLITLLMIAAVIPAGAQRRITPVNPTPAAGEVAPTPRDTTLRKPTLRPNLAHYHDENGNVVYVDTITGLEVADTLLQPQAQSIPKMIYPLLYKASVGVDLWDPVMRAIGQHYGLIGFSAAVNLHNRYIPTIEVGLGNANYTPEEGNFTYKGAMAPYFKLGADYNFFYNSNPMYQLYAGLRFGFTHFNFDVSNISMADPYWGVYQTVDIPRQSVTAITAEFLLGVRVTLWHNWAMGWALRYHGLVSQSSCRYGDPWYIPGIGTASSHWGGSFSLYYTLPLK